MIRHDIKDDNRCKKDEYRSMKHDHRNMKHDSRGISCGNSRKQGF